MAKQFGFEQLFRQRAAVDRHERLIMTRAGVVDRLGDDLLPGPALAINQYADIRLRHHSGLLKQAQHQRAAGYNRPGAGLRRWPASAAQRLINGFI